KIARRLAGGGKRAGFRDDRGASSKLSRPRSQLAGADSIMSYDLRDLVIANRMRGDDAIDFVRPQIEQQLAAKAIHPIANRHSPAIQPYLRLFGADQIVRVTEGGGGVTHFGGRGHLTGLLRQPQTRQRLPRLLKERPPFAP